MEQISWPFGCEKVDGEKGEIVSTPAEKSDMGCWCDPGGEVEPAPSEPEPEVAVVISCASMSGS